MSCAPFKTFKALKVAGIAYKQTPAHYIEEEIDHETNDDSVNRHYPGTGTVCE